MSFHLYANLAPMGWTELLPNDDEKPVIGSFSNPLDWYEEGMMNYAKSVKDVITDPIDTMRSYKEIWYIDVFYQNRNYHVTPTQLQVVID